MWQKIKNIYHLGVAILANIYFGFPAQKITVIGITGTDGKTTTTSLIYHILKTAGKQVSLISTVAAYIDGKTLDTGFHVTNPSSVPLQRFLKRIAQLGNGKEKNYLVLEVTSHGIDQNRVWGIPFAIAGVTNITHEHLDYHKTYENYVATKAKLLQSAKVAVVNKDDGSFSMLHDLLKDHEMITYGMKNADITRTTVAFKTNLPGEYNMYNCLLAVTICRQLGIADKDIAKGISTFTPPAGRTEIVYKKDFTIMIDFAHTPNAFEQLLSALRPKVKGRLIHVFGSAGLRDASKRPLMGKAASTYDDIIILTAEDPRSEKIEKINEQIKDGITTPRSVQVIEIQDRKEAIQKAISLAKKGDFVVITGKAHEKSINYGKGEEPWDEFEEVKKAVGNKKADK